MPITKLIKPEENAAFRPWLNIGYVAGRTRSSEMFENSKEVFESAFRMIDQVGILAKNSHDVETSKKIEKLTEHWRHITVNAVKIEGINDLKDMKEKLAGQTDV